MASPDAQQTLEHAAAALQAAQLNLSHAVQHAYPLGASVHVRHGKRVFTMRVAGYGANWSSPGEVRCNHLVTGKPRRFHYSAILGLAL